MGTQQTSNDHNLPVIVGTVVAAVVYIKSVISEELDTKQAVGAIENNTAKHLLKSKIASDRLLGEHLDIGWATRREIKNILRANKLPIRQTTHPIIYAVWGGFAGFIATYVLSKMNGNDLSIASKGLDDTKSPIQK